MNLREVVEKIGPEDQGAREEAHRRWSACAKPLGGLGFLETVVENVAALTGSAAVDFSHRALLVLCADNGVVAQGVTQSPSSVTAAVAGNLAAGRSAVCMMAKVARWESWTFPAFLACWTAGWATEPRISPWDPP